MSNKSRIMVPLTDAEYEALSRMAKASRRTLGQELAHLAFSAPEPANKKRKKTAA